MLALSPEYLFSTISRKNSTNRAESRSSHLTAPLWTKLLRMRKALLLSGLIFATGGGIRGLVTLSKAFPVVAPVEPSCASCTTPIYQQSSQARAINQLPGYTAAELEACLSEIEITEAGPYDVIVTENGQTITNRKLTADSAAVQGKRFAPLAQIPANGNEELQIRDSDGVILAKAYLHIPRVIPGGAAHSSTFSATDSTSPTPIPAADEVPPGYRGGWHRGAPRGHRARGRLSHYAVGRRAPTRQRSACQPDQLGWSGLLRSATPSAQRNF